MKKLSVGMASASVAVLFLAAGTGYGATYSNTVGGTSGFAAKDGGRHYVLENTLNFRTYHATTGDVFQLLIVPGSTIVERVYLKVTATSSVATTVDVGDGSDADGWLDDVSLQTKALSASALTFATLTNTITYATGFVPSFQNVNGTNMVVGITTNLSTVVVTNGVSPTGYTEGKTYAAWDTLDVTVGGVATNGALTLGAVLEDVSGQ